MPHSWAIVEGTTARREASDSGPCRVLTIWGRERGASRARRGSSGVIWRGCPMPRGASPTPVLASNPHADVPASSRNPRAHGLLLSSTVLISRCVWHPRNYGRAKLLGVSSWRGWGFAFTDGLCDKCAVRIHPAVRPMVVRDVEMPKRGCGAIVVVVSAVMTVLVVLVARPISDVPRREFPTDHVASLPREMPPPGVPSPPQGASLPRETPPSRVASPPQGAPLPREAPPRRLRSSTLPRPVRLAQATHPGSPASAGRLSRARASRPTESSTARTGRLYQFP